MFYAVSAIFQPCNGDFRLIMIRLVMRERERERERERARVGREKHISILYVLPRESKLALPYKFDDAPTITHRTRSIVPDSRTISIDD